MRCCLFAFFSIFCFAAPLAAQPSAPEPSWDLDFSFQQYYLPDDDDLSLPVLTLSTEKFIFEARYNYERREAGSFWLGIPFAWGEEWELEITPMAGAVIGAMHGAAPGLKADLSWKALNLYSEMEYVFDFDTRDENFFYSWSELTVGLTDWFRAGIVGNRTRAYSTEVELDRGPIVRLEFENFSIYCTALNLDSDIITVLGVEISPTGLVRKLRH